MKTSEVNARIHPEKPRVRDAVATRRALLTAGTELFAQASYDQVGVRAIAERAGVNQALLTRYFGGKAGLFSAVAAELFSDTSWIPADRSSFGAQISAYLFAKTSGAQSDPLALILRSSSHPEALEIVRSTLASAVVAPLAAWLGEEEAAVRATALVAILTGVSVLHTLLQLPVTADVTRRDHEFMIGRLLQAVVDRAY